ncbi:hypothetical protein ANCCAN_02608 [Ancylostoma caninum]|uniref:Uncharacterized protein n=1 Tax=Ancylostoma caninum TaxID=29170 RepID=A0A368H7H3_ANCCA|nr:hypothetical protein ANCCAN_02608 [Ancylostoma caninum]
MFALCTFIAATLGAIILDGIENSIKSGGNPVTQAKSHKNTIKWQNSEFTTVSRKNEWKSLTNLNIERVENSG